jgi:hypothetical protein
MESTRFDYLIKRLAAQPMTRATALRGLAASAAAMAGVTLVAESGEARKNNKKKRVCNCTSSDPASCVNQKKKKKAVNRLLNSNDCAYKGRCQTGVSGCAAPAPLGCSPATSVSQGTCQPGQICSLQAICVAGCTTTTTGTRGSCPAGQICIVAPGQTTGHCQNEAFGCSPANNTRGTCPEGQICSPQAICVQACTPACNPNQICCPPGTAKAGTCHGTLQAC